LGHVDPQDADRHAINVNGRVAEHHRPIGLSAYELLPLRVIHVHGRADHLSASVWSFLDAKQDERVGALANVRHGKHVLDQLRLRFVGAAC
jgi:hypothetical protein